MCGIFGVVGEIDRARAEGSLARLAHRGPDGAGTWAQPGILLGHRRLAILDLSDAGRQPMASSDGRYHITFNGEIYNFLELREELRGFGHAFRTDSDTEVILAAFAQWGEGCLGRFNGMWAFAIWDAREQALFLARDRFGKKPLFHAQLPDIGFVFASEMKAIVPLMKSVQPNQRLIASRGRMFTYEAGEECLVQGVHRFPAATCGWYRDGRLTLRRWWCTLDHLVEVPRRYEEQVELLRERFLDACRLRMRSDVPIGTALSGGLDSSATISAVAHVAKTRGLERTAAGWQHAFVASFPGTPLDEAPFARRVCEHIGIAPRVIEIDAARAARDLLHYCYLFEELYVTSPIPFMLTYAAVREAGVRVTLDGHAADELFGGYPTDFPVAMWDAGLDRTALDEILRTYADALPGDRAQFPRLGGGLALGLRWQARDLVKRLLGFNARLTGSDRAHPMWRRLDHLSRRLYITTHETILPTLLRNYDRYSMANGVEIRMPFLDHRVVCLAFSLPWRAKIRAGFSKAIVRDAVAPFLPREIAYRKTKIGFNSPTLDWLRGPLREFVLDALADRSFAESAVIDARRVRRAVEDVVRGPAPTFAQAERAWALLSPYLWEQAFLKGLGVPGAQPRTAGA